MMKHAPEWVRTCDPVIRSPVRYRYTTAPAHTNKETRSRSTCSSKIVFHCGVSTLVMHARTSFDRERAAGPGQQLYTLH